MKSDKPTTPIGGMSSRQKIIGIIFVVILIFLAWQGYSMFKSDSGAPLPFKSSTSQVAQQPPMVTPQPTQLPAKPQQPVSQAEADLLKLQDETELKYLTALNELEMLRITRQIAETNQAIAASKLARVTSEKSIIDLLKPAPPAPPAYTQGLEGGALPPGVPPPPTAIVTPEITYTVISVSNVRNKWRAVLGAQGTLYQVAVGDVVPADQSTVIAIDRNGVILEKNGIRKRISIVPVI